MVQFNNWDTINSKKYYRTENDENLKNGQHQFNLDIKIKFQKRKNQMDEDFNDIVAQSKKEYDEKVSHAKRIW